MPGNDLWRMSMHEASKLSDIQRSKFPWVWRLRYAFQLWLEGV